MYTSTYLAENCARTELRNRRTILMMCFRAALNNSLVYYIFVCPFQHKIMVLWYLGIRPLIMHMNTRRRDRIRSLLGNITVWNSMNRKYWRGLQNNKKKREKYGRRISTCRPSRCARLLIWKIRKSMIAREWRRDSASGNKKPKKIEEQTFRGKKKMRKKGEKEKKKKGYNTFARVSAFLCRRNCYKKMSCGGIRVIFCRESAYASTCICRACDSFFRKTSDIERFVVNHVSARDPDR